jgi:hypothetical protein
MSTPQERAFFPYMLPFSRTQISEKEKAHQRNDFRRFAMMIRRLSMCTSHHLKD